MRDNANPNSGSTLKEKAAQQSTPGGQPDFVSEQSPEADAPIFIIADNMEMFKEEDDDDDSDGDLPKIQLVEDVSKHAFDLDQILQPIPVYEDSDDDESGLVELIANRPSDPEEIDIAQEEVDLSAGVAAVENSIEINSVE